MRNARVQKRRQHDRTREISRFLSLVFKPRMLAAPLGSRLPIQHRSNLQNQTQRTQIHLQERLELCYLLGFQFFPNLGTHPLPMSRGVRIVVDLIGKRLG